MATFLVSFQLLGVNSKHLFDFPALILYSNSQTLPMLVIICSNVQMKCNHAKVKLIFSLRAIFNVFNHHQKMESSNSIFIYLINVSLCITYVAFVCPSLRYLTSVKIHLSPGNFGKVLRYHINILHFENCCICISVY